MGIVPALLAERLAVPQVTFAGQLTVSGDTVEIVHDGEASSENVTASLPAVVSVTDRTGEARYPSFKGIMAAKSKPVDQLTVADLGLDASEVGAAGSRQEITDVADAEARSGGEIVVDEGDGAQRIVAFLEQLKVI